MRRSSRAAAPLTGPLPGGTTVTITGMNFSGATDVYFGGVEVPVDPDHGQRRRNHDHGRHANVFDMVDRRTATGDMVLNGPISYSYSGRSMDASSCRPRTPALKRTTDVDFVPEFLWDTATLPYRR